MSNAISRPNSMGVITAPQATQETPPPATGGATKVLYGTATPALTGALELLKQLPLTAQAAVKANNPELQ